jgi:pimeloyl-ACP methyl ester carboxylesterase
VIKFPGISDCLQNFKQLVPNLRDTAFIKDAAHFVMEEQPKEFNEKLLTFLAALQNDSHS